MSKESHIQNVTENEQERIASLVENGALEKGLLFHKKRASERDAETGIPCIELSYGIDDSGIIIESDDEYVIPLAPNEHDFIPNYENINKIKMRAGLIATDLATAMWGNTNIESLSHPLGGTKWEDKSPSSPWGDLTITFYEEVDPDDEYIELTAHEYMPTPGNQVISRITYDARIHLNGKFDISQYEYKEDEIPSDPPSQPRSQAFCNNEEDFQLDKDANRLVAKATKMVDYYLCRED